MPCNRESIIGALIKKRKGDGMAIVLQPTRDELITACSMVILLGCGGRPGAPDHSVRRMV
jgi:hypothetical protein